MGGDRVNTSESMALDAIAQTLGDMRDMMRDQHALAAQERKEVEERANWRAAKLEAWEQLQPCLYCESTTGLWIKRGTTIVGCTVCVGNLLASIRHAPDCAIERDAGEPGSAGIGCTCGLGGSPKRA